MTRTSRTNIGQGHLSSGRTSRTSRTPLKGGVRYVRDAVQSQTPSMGDPCDAVAILGIDPGLRATGWGAIAIDGSHLTLIGAGTITTVATDDLGIRLAAIHRGLDEVLGKIEPSEVAVEQTFVSANGQSTLKLGQARGIAMLAPAARGIPVAEYAPTLVKKTVVGAGHADKKQIRRMVQVLLPGATDGSEHAFDALAIAICHASHRRAAQFNANSEAA